ncbi:hypothetical protein SALB1_0351 [Salinisphaera sp. LB1]|nr:hypothetical protein SALB1_0351 [Salinisphaera sp. LB1]
MASFFKTFIHRFLKITQMAVVLLCLMNTVRRRNARASFVVAEHG